MEPTGWQKFRYYTLGLTLPVSYRDWVEHDVETTDWQVRRFFQVLVGILIGLAIIGPVIRGLAWEAWKGQVTEVMLGVLIAGIIGAVLQATVLADHARRWTLSYYRKKWNRQLRV